MSSSRICTTTRTGSGNNKSSSLPFWTKFWKLKPLKRLPGTTKRLREHVLPHLNTIKVTHFNRLFIALAAYFPRRLKLTHQIVIHEQTFDPHSSVTLLQRYWPQIRCHRSVCQNLLLNLAVSGIRAGYGQDLWYSNSRPGFFDSIYRRCSFSDILNADGLLVYSRPHRHSSRPSWRGLARSTVGPETFRFDLCSGSSENDARRPESLPWGNTSIVLLAWRVHRLRSQSPPLKSPSDYQSFVFRVRVTLGADYIQLQSHN